jgi:hypothetical protein
LASSSCGRPGRMRQESVDSCTVFCEACNRRCCEWCLLKLTSGQGHGTADCDAGLCIQLCRVSFSPGGMCRQMAMDAHLCASPCGTRFSRRVAETKRWSTVSRLPNGRRAIGRLLSHALHLRSSFFVTNVGKKYFIPFILLGIATVTSDVGNGDNHGSGGVALFPDAMRAGTHLLFRGKGVSIKLEVVQPSLSSLRKRNRMIYLTKLL